VSVHWGCYYATALDIEVDPQRCRFGSRKSDFALQAPLALSASVPPCTVCICSYMARGGFAQSRLDPPGPYFGLWSQVLMRMQPVGRLGPRGYR